ncbi:MAG: glyoxylate/hydroxypyruvate reductase A [Rhodobacteraceae bacterium]|nr:glyoxylate/hydroxypyruvate reductase A [Paracoccaceae bacterium]
MPDLLFSCSDDEHAAFAPPILEACRERGLDIRAARVALNPAAVDYIVFTPDGPVSDFAPFTGLKAALSLWAGVERIVGNPSLTAPLCRMVDPGLTAGMVEYVTGHVLRYHLGLDAVLAAQDGEWRPGLAPPLADHRTIGILGLGALGAAVGGALAALGFRVIGWSRRPKQVEGLECLSGEAGLIEVLMRAGILVTLLPATPETENLLDVTRLAVLQRGARIINPGRGSLIDEAALLAALDSGQVAHATLDVFRTEPLPPEHPFWAHPNVTVTPHIAAATRPGTAAEVIAENIRRGEAGEPFLHRVDRSAGY